MQLIFLCIVFRKCQWGVINLLTNIHLSELALISQDEMILKNECKWKWNNNNKKKFQFSKAKFKFSDSSSKFSINKYLSFCFSCHLHFCNRRQLFVSIARILNRGALCTMFLNDWTSVRHFQTIRNFINKFSDKEDAIVVRDPRATATAVTTTTTIKIFAVKQSGSVNRTHAWSEPN